MPAMCARCQPLDDLADAVEAWHLPGEVGEPSGAPGDQLKIIGALSCNTEIYTVCVGELAPQFDTGQENLVDVHRTTVARSDSFHLTAIRGGSHRLSW